MITQLRGKLVEKNPTYVVLEVGGVGYWLNISLNTFSLLPNEESVLLYTYLSVKEDSHTLFGFINKIEREIFKLLISVSGVGPSIARTMLSSMSTDEIQQAIASGNVGVIQSVKGIGTKTAQRVLVDLKDKISKTFAIDEVSFVESNTNKIEALSALEVLGFNKKQSEKVLDKILLEDSAVNVEILIKKALKNL
ncbi:MAG: Holliday junction branch migration protein RuvA [Lutibacter sp.]|uniref:Holliday junction branch migration protein RuvA n=1 Tax=Lutibacter sp. TaxID=1925666 RepID=UPI0018162BB5|nr:Holliday junction branch migration protein RuvA [Lutibacter sp.]MBT8316456.1 Holliday junction branch migration protein RuvA [Lutibacter sp.]NNJ57316.1 Holliday junction branch migration protein RuvA [Lutibacter sp.]